MSFYSQTPLDLTSNIATESLEIFEDRKFYPPLFISMLNQNLVKTYIFFQQNSG